MNNNRYVMIVNEIILESIKMHLGLHSKFKKTEELVIPEKELEITDVRDCINTIKNVFKNCRLSPNLKVLYASDCYIVEYNSNGGYFTNEIIENIKNNLLFNGFKLFGFRPCGENQIRFKITKK